MRRVAAVGRESALVDADRAGEVSSRKERVRLLAARLGDRSSIAHAEVMGFTVNTYGNASNDGDKGLASSLGSYCYTAL